MDIESIDYSNDRSIHWSRRCPSLYETFGIILTDAQYEVHLDHQNHSQYQYLIPFKFLGVVQPI